MHLRACGFSSYAFCHLCHRTSETTFSKCQQMNRYLAWVVLAVAVVGGIVFIRCHIELQSDRDRIAARCREWSNRLKRDANDKDALNHLVAVLNGKWSFAATYA